MAWGEGVPGKWLELLHETVPRVATIAVILDPNNPVNRELVKELQDTAPKRRLKLKIMEVREAEALDAVFDRARREAQAALVLPAPVFLTNQQRIAGLAARHRLPAMYAMRDYADAGGLIAYAPDMAVMFRRGADYVDKILKGTKAGDLPIEQPTRYQLIVNLKAAKALGLTIPEAVLVRADEVIQ